jgi:hypothetical protein
MCFQNDLSKAIVKEGINHESKVYTGTMNSEITFGDKIGTMNSEITFGDKIGTMNSEMELDLFFIIGTMIPEMGGTV